MLLISERLPEGGPSRYGCRSPWRVSVACPVSSSEPAMRRAVRSSVTSCSGHPS